MTTLTLPSPVRSWDGRTAVPAGWPTGVDRLGGSMVAVRDLELDSEEGAPLRVGLSLVTVHVPGSLSTAEPLVHLRAADDVRGDHEALLGPVAAERLVREVAALLGLTVTGGAR